MWEKINWLSYAILTGSCKDINSASACLPPGTIYVIGAKQEWIHFYAEL